MMRRAGRPGLVGLAARTAVVAGTVGVVRKRGAAKEERRSQAQVEQEQYQAAQQQAATEAVNAQAAPPPPPAADTTDVVAELQKLGELKQQGLLDDAEFAAAKAKLLG